MYGKDNPSHFTILSELCILRVFFDNHTQMGLTSPISSIIASPSLIFLKKIRPDQMKAKQALIFEK